MSLGSDIAAEVAAALGEASSSVGDGELKAYVIRRGERTGPDFAPVYAADVAYECNAVVFSSTDRHQALGLVQRGDKSVMLSALSVRPEPNDRLQVSGMLYEIANVMPGEYGGVDLFYDVLVTGGSPDSTVYEGTALSPAFVLDGLFSVQHTQAAHSLSVSAGVRTALPLEPDQIIQTSAPASLVSHDFFVGGRFNPIKSAETDLYEMTVELLVTPSIDGEVLTIDLDIGDLSSIPIKPATVALTSQAGEAQQVGFTFDFYTGATFNANGGLLHVTSKGALQIGSASIKVDVERLG